MRLSSMASRIAISSPGSTTSTSRGARNCPPAPLALTDPAPCPFPGPFPAGQGAGNGPGNGQGAGSVSASGAGGQFLAPREVLVVLPGLLMAILLAMLDNLIVSTALPRIVGDLGGVAHLSWVVTAYILAS